MGKIPDFDEEDLKNTFEKFGYFQRAVLSPDRKEGFLFFGSFINAYVAFKLMKNLSLRDSLEVEIEWMRNHDYGGFLAPYMTAYANSLNWKEILFQ